MLRRSPRDVGGITIRERCNYIVLHDESVRRVQQDRHPRAYVLNVIAALLRTYLRRNPTVGDNFMVYRNYKIIMPQSIDGSHTHRIVQHPYNNKCIVYTYRDRTVDGGS